MLLFVNYLHHATRKEDPLLRFSHGISITKLDSKTNRSSHIMSQLLSLTEEILSSIPEIGAVVTSFKKGYIDDVSPPLAYLTNRRRAFRP